jgi:hypothetical protein
VSYAVRVISYIHSPEEIRRLINDLLSNYLERYASGLNWFEARVGLEGLVGILLITSPILLQAGKDLSAIFLG